MSSSPPRHDWFRYVPEDGVRRLPAGLAVDDGVSIESVTRVERPEGRALRAVIVWIEDGRRVGAVFELPEEPVNGPGRPFSPEAGDRGDVAATDRPTRTDRETGSR